MLRSQYHGRREGRGVQDGKSSETTYMCPWYSVDVGTSHQGQTLDLSS